MLSVVLCVCFFFFKQKTSYELRITAWSSDGFSSDLVAARKRARHREVDGKGRLADTALSVSDCQYHSALAPLAIWLRCSMVCNAKGYTFDWGAYSPSSPSSSLSSSSGSGSSGRD